jgi:cell wall-associated NlpC family hydrolase
VNGPQATDLGMGPNVNGSGSSSFTPQVAGASGKAAVAIKFAMSQLGKPYKWGGNGPSAWDCSSLVQAAYRAAGLPIPRTTWDQMKGGAAVASLAGAQPGDLLFFGGGSHVAIYLGNGQMIEAPRTGLNVRQTSVRTPTSIRRFF